jgi:hypothetical protein
MLMFTNKSWSIILVALLLESQSTTAFVPSSFGGTRCINVIYSTTSEEETTIAETATTTTTTAIDERTGKRTGTSFLPLTTIEQAMVGSPIEKIKLEKDGTSAFVDVYEYARKIRDGEMTWEEVDKADLDTVRGIVMHLYT